MSRTDKDRPWWVVAREQGNIDHDHRAGECRLEGAYRELNGASLWRHRYLGDRCAKRVETRWFCTRTDPVRRGGGRYGCWLLDAVYGDDGELVRLRQIACTGHTRVTFDADVPCSCDNLPPAPTCTYRWPDDRRYRWGTGADDTARAVYYHRPQRRQARDELRNLAREYNTYGEVDDADPPTRQARGSVRWLMD